MNTLTQKIAKPLAVMTVVLVSACATTTDPYTGEERATRTTQAAAIGAGSARLSVRSLVAIVSSVRPLGLALVP